MIRYSCHSENFGLFSPEETFRLVHSLHFDCIDVASRSLIPQSEIIACPEQQAKRFAALSARHSLPLSELFLSGVELDKTPIPPSSEAAQSDAFLRAFDTICAFAEEAGFKSIMGSAGKEDPDLGFSATFERTARTLRRQTEIAKSHNLGFHVEPSRQSLLHTVSAALDMIRAVPDLRYTLDFLHYHIQGIPLSESMKLIPYAGHLHARQSRIHTGKCDFSDGELDYASIVSQLKLHHWDGDIAMEFWCSPQMLSEGLDPIEQNILMRYTLKKLFQ